MIYWLLGIILIIALLISFAFYRKYKAKQKRLAEIRNKWGKPYFNDQNFSLIGIYAESKLESNKITNATANDLDLENIFAYIDRTNSKPGQQYLYNKLHNPILDTAELQQLDKNVTALGKDRAKQERIELELSKLNTKNAYYLPELFVKEQQPLFTPLQTSYIQISWIIMICLIVMLTLVHSQVYFLALLGLGILNTALHYKNKGKIAQYTHSLPQLLVLNKVGWWLIKNVAVCGNERILAALGKIDKLKRSLLFVSFQNSISSDPLDIFSAVFELIKTVFLLESVMFISSLKKVNKYRAEIEDVYKYVAEIDTLIAIDSVRTGLPYYTKPVFTKEDVELKITELYHPLVDKCVANSIASRADKGGLITGSNMSGKTTFIRAVALNTLLAQTIYTCCAKEYDAPLLNIHTSIRVSDDIEEHKSYFQAEALAVLDIVKQCGINEPFRSLVIIDEIFRGTNTIERIAAAKSVLSYLTANRNFVFVSTHDLELAELLGDDYAIYSFEELVNNKRLVFDYKIKEGLLKNKNGIAILESLGYPSSVVKDAGIVSEQLRQKYQL
jgi:DNA mismatch repair ATPase MutS